VRITTVTCDRCRRVIEADMAVIQGQGTLKDVLGSADLCGPCARELLEWLRGTRKNDDARQTTLDEPASASI
jgi:hypothetical protein